MPVPRTPWDRRTTPVLFALVAAGCTHANVRTVDAYLAATKRADYKTARTYLAEDPRVWFETKDGEGKPLRPQGGPYAEWDRKFHGTSERSRPVVQGNTVSYVITENNDFYRLIERQPGKVRLTYYLDDEGKIEGYLVEGLTPYERRPPDRRCEFERWAAQKYPGLLESNEMKIPNNPRRWRELLIEWRADVGLPALE